MMAEGQYPEIKEKTTLEMQRLYYGLEDIPVPAEYKRLVNTNNPTMDGVNYYNMVLAMQDALKKIDPTTFGNFK